MPTIDPNSPVPLYHQVYKSLIERIQSGEFAPGSLLPGWRQLADEYQVSSITIIKSLEILQQQGFVDKKRGKGTTVLNPFASDGVSKLATQRKTVVFYSGVGTHPFLLDMLIGITSVTSELGFNLQVIGSDENPVDERREILNVVDNGCDGLIAYPVEGQDNIDLFTSLVDQKLPLVLVDRYFKKINSDCVLNDDEEGGYQLTKALIEQGHRKIAVVHLQSYEGTATSVRDRIKGYQRALAENGIPLDKNLTWLDIYSKSPFIQDYKTSLAAREILKKRINKYEPTALLSINQDTAQRVATDLHTIQSEYSASSSKDHIQDVSSMATFSFSDNLRMDPFQLTLACQSGRTLGCEAAKLLINRINQPGSSRTTTIRVPVAIVPAKGDEPVTT